MTPGGLIDDRFRIERLAGAGGMGVVFHAIDLHDDRPVAIKVLLREGDDVLLRRFVREAERLGDLEHPHIVRYIAHGSTTRGEPYLAMEWLEGETLAARLERAPLGLDDVLAMGRALASALGAAHRRGLIHRDVKPANIFLCEFDPTRPKLLDFGIARTHRETTITREGVVLGTAGYMAPEQARGERSLDARVDVFALGCVLFHCITGEPPYGGDHPLAWLGQLLTEPPPRVVAHADVDAALDDAIAHLMAKNRDDRPRDGDAAQAVLDAIVLPVRDDPRARISDPTITSRERRVVSLLVAELAAPQRPSAVATVSESTPEPGDELLASISRAAARYDGAAARASDGRILASWMASGGSVEPAIRAAHAAIEASALNPTARIALVTGTTDSDGSRPANALVVRATDALASMMRNGISGVRLDPPSAALLANRFVVRADSGHDLLEATDTGEWWQRAVDTDPTPLVGRDRELRLVNSALDDVIDERCVRMIVVSAPAGAGKSRLAREFARAARGRARVLVAHGDPVGSGAALSLVRQWLARAAGVESGLRKDIAREKLFGHLQQIALPVQSRAALFLAELLDVPIDDPGEARGALVAARNDPRIMHEQVRDALEAWLRKLTLDAPLVLVCEDVQWSDAASARLLAALQRRVADAPWMVLALARGHATDSPPAGWQDADAEHVTLGLLSASASEKLARICLGARSDAKLAKQIAERGGGNPFVIEQLARHVLDLDEAGHSIPASLPDSILALLDARLASLEPHQRRLLRAASVFGAEFDESGVRELLGLGDDHRAGLEDDCRALARHGLLALDGSRWSFRHDLLREAAYAQLLPEEREAAHRCAAQALVARGGLDALKIAAHFERGALPRDAVHWLVQATRAALDAGDGTTAGELVGRALAHGVSDEAERGVLHVLAAQAAGFREDWRVALDEARAGCALVPAGSADWFVGVGGAIFAGAMIGDLGDTPSFVAALRVQPASGAVTGPRMWGLFLAVTGLQVFGLYDEVQRFVGLAEAMLAADANPDPAAIGWFHITQARIAVFERADLALARVAAHSACEQMELAGGSFGRAFAIGSLGLALLEMGSIEPAVETLARAMALTTSQAASTTIIAIWYARALECAGRYREALECLERALDVAGASLLAQNARARHASVLFASGRVDEAVREASRDELRNEAVAHGVRARAALARGDAESAIALCEAALALDARQPHTPTDHMLALTTLAAAHRARGDEAAYRTHSESADAYRARVLRDASERSIP